MKPNEVETPLIRRIRINKNKRGKQMKITENEFFNNLDKINVSNYLIDHQRNMNYFIYNGFKYCIVSTSVTDIGTRSTF